MAILGLGGINVTVAFDWVTHANALTFDYHQAEWPVSLTAIAAEHVGSSINDRLIIAAVWPTALSYFQTRDLFKCDCLDICRQIKLATRRMQ